MSAGFIARIFHVQKFIPVFNPSRPTVAIVIFYVAEN